MLLLQVSSTTTALRESTLVTDAMACYMPASVCRFIPPLKCIYASRYRRFNYLGSPWSFLWLRKRRKKGFDGNFDSGAGPGGGEIITFNRLPLVVTSFKINHISWCSICRILAWPWTGGGAGISSRLPSGKWETSDETTICSAYSKTIYFVWIFLSYSNLHLNPNISVSSEPYSDTSDGFLSLGDSGSTGTLQLRCRMAVASRHYIATSFISPN